MSKNPKKFVAAVLFFAWLYTSKAALRQFSNHSTQSRGRSLSHRNSLKVFRFMVASPALNHWKRRKRSMNWPVTFCIQMISARMACRWHRSPQHIGSCHHPNFETWSRLKWPFLNPLALLPTEPSCKNLHQVILQRLQMGRETSVQQIGQSHIEITFSKPRSRRPDSLHHVCPSPATHHHLVGNITVTPHLFFPYSTPQRLVRHPCPGTASKQIIVATLPVASCRMGPYWRIGHRTSSYLGGPRMSHSHQLAHN